MAALRLFISHSSRKRDNEADDPLAQHNWQLLQDTVAALDRLYGSKIEVLVDYQEVHAGDEWELRLYELVYDCHAAISLLSRRAMEQSDWVKIETTVLVSRATLDPEFHLFPVLLAEQTTKADLEKNFFGAHRITRWQCVENAATAKDIIDAIKPTLGDPETLRSAQPTTFQKLLGAVERLLAVNVDRETLEDLWESLFPGTRVKLVHRNPVKRHARALGEHLLCDGEQSLPRFQKLFKHLQPPLLHGRATQLLNYVHALWVKETAAALIPPARLDHGKCLLLNGQYLAQSLSDSSPRTDHFTLKRYLERAWPVTCESHVIQVLDTRMTATETTKELIQRQIRDYFRRRDQVNDDVADRRISHDERQIAVLLRAEHWSGDVPDQRLIRDLNELKSLYSKLIFVFGIDGEMPDALPTDVVPIVPKLDLATEQEQYYAESVAWDLINNAY